MPQEKIFADFSGGMNASVAVDKLQDNELLLAENIRLDELGNASITGASSFLNTSAYSDGTSPNIGAVAGVGNDVFTGLTLATISDTLTAQNTTASKMSFTSSPNRIYFDVADTPYFIGGSINKPTTVDWAPPAQIAPTPSGPFNPASSGTSTYLANSPHWSNSAGVIGTASGTATCQFVSTSAAYSDYVRAINPAPSAGVAPVQGVQVTAKLKVASNITGGSVRFLAILEIGGASIGSPRSFFVSSNSGTVTATFGGVADLWGNLSITPAQVNASNFGVRITCLNGIGSGAQVTCSVQNVQFSIYQESGTATVAGTGTTGTLTGSYTYIVTFASDQGEESDASSPSNQVVVSGQQVALSDIPIGDSRTVARNVYRTGGALTTYYLITTISDNVTTTYNDNITDLAALTEGVILPGATPGDTPNTRLGSGLYKYPAYHYDRVFWANQTPGSQNQIIWSKPLNGFAYPASNSLNVGDSKPITGLISLFGMLFIIKTDSIWQLLGTDENSFSLSQTLSPVGTDQPFTIVPLSNRIIFSNARGIWAFNGYTSTKITSKLDPWFRQEDRTNVSIFGVNGFHPIEVVNTSVTDNFCGVVTPQEYYLSYAEAGQATNNAILVIDLNSGQITKRPKHARSLFTNPLTGYVYSGDSLGYVQRLDDWTASSDAVLGAVNMDLQTKYYDMASRGSNLAIWAVEFFINTGGNTVTPTVYYDKGAAAETLSAFSTTGLQRVVRPLSSANSRKAQDISIRLNASSKNVNSNGAPTITLDHIKVLYDVRSGRARTGQ
jgi:hypothetical protein